MQLFLMQVVLRSFCGKPHVFFKLTYNALKTKHKHIRVKKKDLVSELIKMAIC